MKSTPAPQPSGAWPFASGEMAQRIRSHNWAATPLGAIEKWPPGLRMLVDLMLHSPRMMALSWGEPALLLYNDAYGRLIGARSTVALGRSAYETFADVRAVFEPHLRAALAGQTVQLHDQFYPFTRTAELEDAWFDEVHHPVHLEDGSVGGVFSILEETTPRVLAERRRAQSEERLHMALSAGAIGTWQYRPETDENFLDPSMCRLAGLPAGTEVISLQTMLQLVHELDRDRVRGECERCLREGADVDMEFRLQRPDGSVIWLRDQGKVHRGPDGRPIFMTGVAIDITERKRAEEARRDSEQRLATVFESLPVGVGLFDTQGVLLLANHEMRRFMPTGRIPAVDEARASRWRAHHGDGRRLEPDEYPGMRALRGQRVLPGIEFLFTQDDGSEIWTRVAALPIRDSRGGVTGAVAVVADVDVAKRAEQALRESEERLRLAVTATGLGVFDWDLVTDRITVNAHLREMLGLEAQADVIGNDMLERVVHPEDRCHVRARLAQAFSGESASHFEFEHRVLAGGGEQWLFTSGQVHFEGAASSQRAVRVIGNALDITERKHVEQTLREREARIRTIANLVPDLLWSNDGQACADWVNRRWLDYTGQTEQEALNQGWTAAIHPEDLPRVQSSWVAAVQAQQAWQTEHRIRAGDGSYRWHLVRAEPLRDPTGRILKWFGSATDIHEQRLSRELLEQRVAERTRALRQLLQRLETLQDDERRRIARELHDGLGQYLASVAVAVSVLRQAPLATATRDMVQRLHTQMQHLDQELDRIVFILRPTALEDCGLADGVAAYVRSWSRLTGVPVELETDGLEGRRLLPSVEASMFRLVQEALTNVAKHARASRVRVILQCHPGQLSGCVEDDGRGFATGDAAASGARQPHWGLLGMRERVEALGGTLAIESQPGSGTSVLWQVPLSQAGP